MSIEDKKDFEEMDSREDLSFSVNDNDEVMSQEEIDKLLDAIDRHDEKERKEKEDDR